MPKASLSTCISVTYLEYRYTLQKSFLILGKSACFDSVGRLARWLVAE